MDHMAQTVAVTIDENANFIVYRPKEKEENRYDTVLTARVCAAPTINWIVTIIRSVIDEGNNQSQWKTENENTCDKDQNDHSDLACGLCFYTPVSPLFLLRSASATPIRIFLWMSGGQRASLFPSSISPSTSQ